MPEKRVTVGPHRARYSRTGAPAPTPGDTKRTYWQVAQGWARSLKMEEKEQRKKNVRPYTLPGFSIFFLEHWEKIACCGRTCLGVGGDRLYVMEDTGTWSPG